jgi:hypothetical protein
MSVTMGYKMTHDTGFAPQPVSRRANACHVQAENPRMQERRRLGGWICFSGAGHERSSPRRDYPA